MCWMCLYVWQTILQHTYFRHSSHISRLYALLNIQNVLAMKTLCEADGYFKTHFFECIPKNSNICCNWGHQLGSLTVLIKFGNLLNILLCSAHTGTA